MSGEDEYDDEKEEDEYEDFLDRFKDLGDPSKLFGNFDPAKLFNSKEFQKMFKEIFKQLAKNLPKELQGLSPEEITREFMKKGPIMYSVQTENLLWIHSVISKRNLSQANEK